jgi:large subunit ribosomal protein L1
MNVNPTKSDQNIRGTCVLPAGLGNVIRICAFASDEFHAQIRQLGVEQIGTDAVLKEISEGTVTFDKIIATQDQMNLLKSYARVLGPKGLMPNVKSGTLVKPDELIEVIRQSK